MIFSLSFVGGGGEGGFNSASGFGPRGSISARGFGPGGRNPLGHPASSRRQKISMNLQINCPTHRSNLGVGWNRGSNSRCRVPKEMSGHGKGTVK